MAAPSNAAIKAFVERNLNDPQAIADAMVANNLSLADISQATGYSTADVSDYFRSAGLGPQGRGQYSDEVIREEFLTHQNDQQSIVRAMADSNVSPQDIARATGLSLAQVQAAIAPPISPTSRSPAELFSENQNAVSLGNGQTGMQDTTQPTQVNLGPGQSIYTGKAINGYGLPDETIVDTLAKIQASQPNNFWIDPATKTLVQKAGYAPWAEDQFGPTPEGYNQVEVQIPLANGNAGFLVNGQIVDTGRAYTAKEDFMTKWGVPLVGIALGGIAGAHMAATGAAAGGGAGAAAGGTASGAAGGTGAFAGLGEEGVKALMISGLEDGMTMAEIQAALSAGGASAAEIAAANSSLVAATGGALGTTGSLTTYYPEGGSSIDIANTVGNEGVLGGNTTAIDPITNPLGTKTVINPDGTKTITTPDGKTITTTPDGKTVTPDGKTVTPDPFKKLPDTVFNSPPKTPPPDKSIVSMLGGGGGVGSLLGGLLGGLGGSKEAGTTTTVTDIPEWLKPYVKTGLDRGLSTLNATPYNNDLNLLAGQHLFDTIQGDYMDPARNPWLKSNLDLGAERIGKSVNSLFEGSGRYGSTAHQGTIGEKVGDFSNQFLFNNYNAERGRQATAATVAPDFTTAYHTGPFAALNQYMNLTKVPGSQTTSPYFENKAGGILSGAMAGGILGKMFK